MRDNDDAAFLAIVTTGVVLLLLGIGVSLTTIDAAILPTGAALVLLGICANWLTMFDMAILTTGVALLLIGIGANWLTTIGCAIVVFTTLFIYRVTTHSRRKPQ